MTFANDIWLTLLSTSFLLGVSGLHAQDTATAVQTVHPSAFAGVSGVYTGLNGGRNVSITAGVDLELRRYFHVNPALEVRATYPVNSGSVDGLRNVLGGLRFSKRYYRLHPYVDILFGRGGIKYTPPLVNPAGTVQYSQSVTNVLSPGAGVEYDVTSNFALRADFQIQRYSTPLLDSGRLFSKPITAALTYRLNFNRHIARGRH